jgi:choline-sulfatase
MSYMDPHDPYFRHPYDGYAIGRAFMPNPDPSQVEEIVGLYDGEIRYWDHHFSRLLEALRQRPDWDRTVVVICADHGEEFQEHGGWWHGTTLYDEEIRVPLVVRLPGSELGGTSEARWVGLIDIAPTLVRLAGGTVPEHMGRGDDLFVAVDTPQPMFSEEDLEGNQLQSIRYQRDGEEWKYIQANAGNPRGLDPQELYDTRSDPGERRNQAGGDAPELDRAQQTLDTARADAARGAAARASVGFDSGAVQQLTNLGYLQKAPPRLHPPAPRSTP